jgi:hypothetical protein
LASRRGGALTRSLREPERGRLVIATGRADGAAEQDDRVLHVPPRLLDLTVGRRAVPGQVVAELCKRLGRVAQALQ